MQVDQTGFLDTQDVASHPGLTAKFAAIQTACGFNWATVTWQDLRKPMYSALAARLFLSNIAEAIPADIAGQARYWKQYYNTPAGSGTEQDFIDRTAVVKGTEISNLYFFCNSVPIYNSVNYRVYNSVVHDHGRLNELAYICWCDFLNCCKFIFIYIHLRCKYIFWR